MPKNLKMYANHLKMYASGYSVQTSQTIFRDEVFDTAIYFLRAVDFFKNVCQKPTIGPSDARWGYGRSETGAWKVKNVLESYF